MFTLFIYRFWFCFVILAFGVTIKVHYLRTIIFLNNMWMLFLSPLWPLTIVKLSCFKTSAPFFDSDTGSDQSSVYAVLGRCPALAEFEVDYIISFVAGANEAAPTLEEALAKLHQLDASGSIWTIRCQLTITIRDLIVVNRQTGVSYCTRKDTAVNLPLSWSFRNCSFRLSACWMRATKCCFVASHFSCFALYCELWKKEVSLFKT